MRRDGFTLLEVLAAVAILGIAYIALGSSGIQGLQYEGEARRRLEASLLADSVLAEIEAGIEAGGAPALGEDEREADGFKIAVAIAPFSIVVPDEQGKNGKRLGNARSRLGGSGAQAQQAAIPGPSLLGDGSGPGAASPLRRIDVSVVWNEGFGERSVSRTTFALDAEAARPTLDAIAQSQAAAQGQRQQPAAPNPLGGGKQGHDRKRAMSAASPRRAAIAHSARRTLEAQSPVSRVASQRRAARPHKAGFTLLEMLAVIFLMSIVLFVAIDFYLDLSVASNTAAEQTRNARRAVGLLDRVARDLEGALLLKKPDAVDPIAWPWLFLAESESAESGAERVKFVRRGHHPNAESAAESDLELVSWIIAPGADGEGDLELRRASWPQLPESLDRSFPTAETSDLVAAGLASFGIQFQDDDGAWTGRWDSTTLAGASELPRVAEIEVSFRTGPGADDVEGPYLRRVLLPLRPIDLEEQLAQAEGTPASTNPRDLDGDGKDDETGEPVASDASNLSGGGADDEQAGEMTVAECLAVAPEVVPMLESMGGPGFVASVKSLRLSAVPPQFSAMIPAACRQ